MCWSVCWFHSTRKVGGLDRRSTSRMMPAQPPSGMSVKSGTVVPGRTRTLAPTGNLAGVSLGLPGFLLLVIIDPLSPTKTGLSQVEVFPEPDAGGVGDAG